MISIQNKLKILAQLSIFLQSEEFDKIIEKAHQHNNWFTYKFLNLAIRNICDQYLASSTLQQFCDKYNLVDIDKTDKTVGIITAGNIPLVGFQDFLCAFLVGIKMKIKMSSKDNVLLKHIVCFLFDIEPMLKEYVFFENNLLKNCDAYLTMGGQFSSAFFEKYFAKYPTLIRSNKTSVAVLYGIETQEDLILLASDIHSYFGLGCRNVSKLYVPQNYDFTKLLKAFDDYLFLLDNKKYKDNYDYNLTLNILNRQKHILHSTVLLQENKNFFSPIGQLNYEYYQHADVVYDDIKNNQYIQCIVSKKNVSFGKTQRPSVEDFPDNKNVILFLQRI